MIKLFEDFWGSIENRDYNGKYGIYTPLERMII